MRIDLHTHSTASDGTDTPAELVSRAAAQGIDVIAITDHDTAAGWRAAIDAKPHNVTIVPGVEMSFVHYADKNGAEDGKRTSLHLLAYFVDADNAALHAEWQRLRESRLHRGEAMVEKLVVAGYPITWQQVQGLADGGSVGRPHIGRALVASGVVPDVTAAFRQLLNSRAGFYIPKADTDVFDALRLVRSAGGLPVFAHPIARRRGPIVSDDVIAAMTSAGLVGIEVEHPDHDDDDRAHAAGLARELGLIPTGSSDYHGHNKTTELGECTTSGESWERLLTLPAARSPVR
jgi:predicted metal-dependent phosphoesterase TrpH